MSQASLTSAEKRERLILEHVPLVKHLVGRLGFDSSGMDRDDLYGVGILGLMAAADSWEESRGLAFSTYAYTRVRGAILDEMRRSDVLPRGRRERVRALNATVAELSHDQGGAPAPEEIAQAMGTDLDTVDAIMADASVARLTSLDDGDDAGLGALLSDPKSVNPAGSLERQELCGLLAEEIAQLSDQEQSVITLYYAEDLLLREIGEVLDVTESRVSQIHSRALYRLNKALSERTGTDDPR